MLHLLKQPFPAHSLFSSIRMAAIIGLFVAVFLLVFQPFGMREATGGYEKILVILGYGLLTFCCISLSAIFLSKTFPKWFIAENWTVGKEIQITLFNFLLIGFFNTLYTFFIFRQPFSLSHLLYFEGITLAVGILPVSLIVLFRYNRLLQTNLKLAQTMNSELKPPVNYPLPETPHVQAAEIPVTAAPQTFTFTSESGTEQITLTVSQFLFAMAADNYIELHYLENGQTRKNLIRSSLTRLEETIKANPKLVRCHRAYLVNLEQVTNFSGNAQGLKLELFNTPESIPVSRKMVLEIKGLLHG
ncbi:LytTR family transcriptional regulator DNA-binding domain-containing protein [Adhaeribacter terreus]|uniref:LytTR family transcriptional regulator DNA-binding domain-containing protein n=1 Tax=Adhaeribacter terreus TaxID=529703 RepID=A0ABW0E9Q1_9BACT